MRACGFCSLVVAATVLGLPIASALAEDAFEHDEYETNVPGTWQASSNSNGSLLGFSQVTVRLTAGSKVNGPAGTLRLALPGGRTVCRARLVMLDRGYNGGNGFGNDALLAVKYSRGTTRKVRRFCMPQTLGERLSTTRHDLSNTMYLLPKRGFARTSWNATEQ